jgi:hypothetical protein
MVLPYLNVRFRCIVSDLWQTDLFKHVSGHNKYGLSEIGGMERWGEVFSASLQDRGVSTGDSKPVFLHNAAVAQPTGGGGRRESDPVPGLAG